MLKLEAWSEIYFTNVNDCFDIFMNIITRALKSATKIKKSNVKNKHVKEWMTMSLLRSVCRKNPLSLKVKKKHPNNCNLLSYYIKYKNTVTTVLRIAKNNFKKKNLMMLHIVQN